MRAGKIARIARWETVRSAGSLDRTTGIALLAVLLVIAALVPILLAVNPTPGAGLYKIGVEESSPYYDVVEEDPELRAVDPDLAATGQESLDVIVSGTDVFVAQTEKGRAAAGSLRKSIASYNDRQMGQESDQAAAFPVDVTLRYLPQAAPQTGGTGETDGTGADEGSCTGGTDGTGETGGENGGSEDSQSEGGTDTQGEVGEASGPIPSAPIGGILGTTQTGTPSGISPPFPLRALLLAFVFLVPFNIVIQAYGSSVISERINRRGEPLLVSPASRGDIVIGKALPYFLGSIAITAAIALAIGGGILSVAAITPIAALFLASTFVAGMLARSYKELTFVTVTISVTLTGYAFIPAVFAEVHPIAAISPLTLVVNDLRGVPVTGGEFIFATLPVALAAMVLFVLGTGIYREEDMFTQRPLPQKALDALAAPLSSTWRVGLWTALFIPFVLVAELFAVAILYILPVTLSIPLLLGAVALIEEVAKSIHVYAGYRRAKFGRSLRQAVTIGAVSGVGFFLAEKLLAITQLVGLPDLEIGRFAFAPEILGVSPALLLFAPLVLHVVTAVITSLGARRTRLTYGAALVVAAVIHLSYNYTVVSALA